MARPAEYEKLVAVSAGPAAGPSVMQPADAEPANTAAARAIRCIVRLKSQSLRTGSYPREGRLSAPWKRVKADPWLARFRIEEELTRRRGDAEGKRRDSMSGWGSGR